MYPLETELATPQNFDANRYLLANSDVAAAIRKGIVRDAREHFAGYGIREGRRQALAASAAKALELDRQYLHADVPMVRMSNHSNFFKLAAEVGNRPGNRVLEVGSREVTGKSTARESFTHAHYVGFDYYPGNNVDVVGDAHKLSTYFDQQFDLIFSSAVFEHLAMPWIAAVEISKLLKVGGHLIVESHFAFSSHERPWHFFHFTDMALKCLFSPALGFECIEAGMSNPLVGRFSCLADEYLRNRPVSGMYCHCDYFGKKVRDVKDFRWEDVKLDELVGETKYPVPVTGLSPANK